MRGRSTPRPLLARAPPRPRSSSPAPPTARRGPRARLAVYRGSSCAGKRPCWPRCAAAVAAGGVARAVAAGRAEAVSAAALLLSRALPRGSALVLPQRDRSMRELQIHGESGKERPRLAFDKRAVERYIGHHRSQLKGEGLDSPPPLSRALCGSSPTAAIAHRARYDLQSSIKETTEEQM